MGIGGGTGTVLPRGGGCNFGSGGHGEETGRRRMWNRICHDSGWADRSRLEQRGQVVNFRKRLSWRTK